MNIENIWKEYRGRLRAFLRSRVPNPADVDDLLQDISIKTFNGLSSLEDHSKIHAWLFQTANRTIIDFYRKNARTKKLHPDDLWCAADDADVHQDLEQCVQPFLAALPSDTAKLLTAIDIEGQSQKDYAAAHGIPYSTVKSRVQKSRAALRAVFENCCHLSLDARGNIADYRSKESSCQNC